MATGTLSPNALVVEDDPEIVRELSAIVGAAGFEVRPARTLEEARKAMEEARLDLAMVDLELPDGSGLDLIQQLVADHNAEIVILTGYGSLDSAIEAFRGGVADYLTKPVDLRRLRLRLTQVGRAVAMRSEIQRMRAELRDLGRFGDMIGSCAAMQALYDQIQRVAPTEATVLITGETGTGKELAAKTVHRLSRRATRPFVDLNCGAAAPSLIESELFGHEKGAFTGATHSRAGIFERAHGGTLLLDEVAEMPVDLQVKLLRVLESSTLRRVGGNADLTVDVRILAATNRNPDKAVGEGKLRQDLLYRLNVFPLELPPLRERGDDVLAIADKFLRQLDRQHQTMKELSPAASDVIRGHDWPGNVRELRNAVERAYILAPDPVILPEHLPVPSRMASWRPAGASEVAPPVGSSIAEMERMLILATVERYQGDKKAAAKVLGISLKTLYTRLSGYGAGRR